MGQKASKDYQVQKIFNLSVFGMSLQLLISILAPLFIGSAIDNHFKTKPLYTLIGLVVGISLSVVVIWNSYKSLTSNTLLDNKINKEDKQ